MKIETNAASKQTRGRYAPSPTGATHLGNARTALLAWLSVRSQAGKFVWRIEDIDTPRNLAGASREAIDDLTWIGLDIDEGGDCGGSFAPYEQSGRSHDYEKALVALADRSKTFPCSLSRKELHSISSAPSDGSGTVAYPPHLRPAPMPRSWYSANQDLKSGQNAIRLAVDPGPTVFVDGIYGRQEEDVAVRVGDFVLKRRDGLYAYQLAVVVDDIAMEINEVVRGRDLLGSTARQTSLIRALGATPPRYVHVPLILGSGGEKLSKRDGSFSLQALKNQQARPEQVSGWLAWSAGLITKPRPVAAQELVAEFSWSKVTTKDYTATSDTIREILSLR